MIQWSSLKSQLVDPNVICNIAGTAPKVRPQLHNHSLCYPIFLSNPFISPDHRTLRSRDILDLVLLDDDHELFY
jgi:hypothetical protein